MAQTRYLRTVLTLTIRDRLRLLVRGRLAISATVYYDRVTDERARIFHGTPADADRWITTGHWPERIDHDEAHDHR